VHCYQAHSPHLITPFRGTSLFGRDDLISRFFCSVDHLIHTSYRAEWDAVSGRRATDKEGRGWLVRWVRTDGAGCSMLHIYADRVTSPGDPASRGYAKGVGEI